MPRRLLALALLGGLLAVAVHAQSPQTAGKDSPAATPSKVERAVYAVKGGDPVPLAEAVTLHFKGEVKVSAVASALVLSGDPAAVAEATKLLDKIDRPTRSVELEVTLVEVTAKDADLPAGEVDPAKLAEWKKAGGTAQTLRLTAAEGQPVASQSGADKPYTSAVNVAGVGFGGPGGGGFGDPQAPGGGGDQPRPRPVQRSVNYRAMGTTVKATSRVGADGAVAVDLNVQDSTIKPAAAGDETGSATFGTASLSTRLSVPPGKAVVAQATRKDAGDARTVTLVVVTAKVVEAGK